MIYEPAKVSYRPSFKYLPTQKELASKEGTSRRNILQQLWDFIANIYWIYYIHLPFYVLGPVDGFYLHVFFLGFFSLTAFGIAKSILSYSGWL